MTDRKKCHTTMTFKCDVCGKPVEDGTGYIYVPERDVRTYEKAHADYEERNRRNRREGWYAVNLAEFLALPPVGRWRATHRKCDPNPNAADYWFDVARCRSALDALGWTTHLMGKVWLPATDWPDFIMRAAVRDA